MNYRLLIPSMIALVITASPLANAQFFGDPPDETHPWAKHDHNRPQPPRVEPAKKIGDPPSDAIVLFDGTEESFKKNWSHERKNRKTDWLVVDGALQSMRGAGYIRTKSEFGDCQLHVEWSAPTKAQGTGQGRGNSGVFLMGEAEVQVLDNYNNPTYADGTAGALYGVMPPMVNPLRSPSEWQSYDIVFRRPIVKDGELVDEGSITVFVNGVLVQDSVPLEGGGGYRKRTHPKDLGDVGPLRLQDHGNPVQFRNIWYREIRKRPSDGGTDGRLSKEATAAKRAENAIRMAEAAKELEGKEKMHKLLESLVYQNRPDVYMEALEMTNAFVAEIKAAPDKVDIRKKDVVDAYRAVKYMSDHKLLPKPMPALQELEQIMVDKDWKKGK